MREVARFEVWEKCIPWSVPEGGKDETGKWRPHIRKDSALTAWQTRVRKQARIAMGNAPARLGPVLIALTFYRQTPPGKRPGEPWEVVVERTDHGFAKRGPPQPDLTNLFKGTEDALAEIVMGNDVQTCASIAMKVYGPQNGVGVVVYALEPGELPSMALTGMVPSRIVA